MSNAINEFRGKYFFLSNYYNCPVTYKSLTYQNTEAAFHAQKDISRSSEFTKLNPADAKKLGRKVTLRKDWELVKDQFMYEIVLAKFKQNPHLIPKLLATGTATLIEGNTWNDKYWGVDIRTNIGQNKLGKILMDIRKLFQNQ